MKKLIFIVVAIIIVALLMINKKLSDKMYEDCLASKKQSQETCEYYAYYK